jgi:2-amino-4-hydroxy-6-hydroxymethyldihydropteridine diphosphokinase
MKNEHRTQVFVGLGGNQGDVFATLFAALKKLDELPETMLVRCSSFYRTPAWGRTDQPDFINAVAELRTELSAEVLLHSLLQIEKQLGRNREDQERWGPRTIDLDLLMFGDSVIRDKALKVPHPHIAERAFVLLPWAEITPHCVIPEMGVVENLLNKLDISNIETVQP